MWGDEEDEDSEEGNTMILKVFTMFVMFNERGNPIMVNIFYHCVFVTFIIL